MKNDLKSLEEVFCTVRPSLIPVAEQIEKNLYDHFSAFPHIDKIACRVKQTNSLLTKAQKINKHGSLKYPNPFREIQDIIGARIVVFYRSDIEKIEKEIPRLFQFVEQKTFVPDDVKEFGYEGVHFICFIPNFITRDTTNHNIPYFFELQIKTLFQHAWAESQHGLGYKPDTPLSWEKERKVAFLAAQSWGADEILMQLLNS